MLANGLFATRNGNLNAVWSQIELSRVASSRTILVSGAFCLFWRGSCSKTIVLWVGFLIVLESWL